MQLPGVGRYRSLQRGSSPEQVLTVWGWPKCSSSWCVGLERLRNSARGPLQTETPLIWGQLLAWRFFSEDIHFKSEFSTECANHVFAILSSKVVGGYLTVLWGRKWSIFLPHENLTPRYHTMVFTRFSQHAAGKIPGANRPRLLIISVLRAKKKVVAHFGLPCASWVLLSRSTARSWLAPLRDVSVKSGGWKPFVFQARDFKSNQSWVSFQSPFIGNNIQNSVCPYWQDVPLDPDLSSPGKLHYRAAIHITLFSTSTILPTHIYD